MPITDYSARVQSFSRTAFYLDGVLIDLLVLEAFLNGLYPTAEPMMGRVHTAHVDLSILKRHAERLLAGKPSIGIRTLYIFLTVMRMELRYEIPGLVYPPWPVPINWDPRQEHLSQQEQAH